MIPPNHPRKKSLEIRHKLIEGYKKGLVAQAGLIAHGRGEAFDYLLGEKTTPTARRAEKAGAALLLTARKPVISVNGNAAALCAGELVRLARLTKASLEVNLFYRNRTREMKIAAALRKAGAVRVYGAGRKTRRIKGLRSNRALVDKALWEGDVVLVMLEDGDRTEALVRAGKKVIAIDLNPLSRTARKATITIVDNVVRTVSNMNAFAARLVRLDTSRLRQIESEWNNKANLDKTAGLVRKGL